MNMVERYSKEILIVVIFHLLFKKQTKTKMNWHSLGSCSIHKNLTVHSTGKEEIKEMGHNIGRICASLLRVCTYPYCLALAIGHPTPNFKSSLNQSKQVGFRWNFHKLWMDVISNQTKPNHTKPNFTKPTLNLL